jgi:hypothetical protein
MSEITALELRLKKHDFEWEYSDSIDVRRWGAADRASLIKSLRDVPQWMALQLIDQYVPGEYKPLFADLITEAK